ncbi:hypothetical protein AVEN_128864-1 [Araneus ventricosus]|uniref:Uncharacterized protein n=1 Tax=Araneus ventricosus TaxID=182803 RepID=A0A4Y2WJ94_ARAVE|nr:hypothetical protein AVEN_128864-1 [Araneus ventricosus]
MGLGRAVFPDLYAIRRSYVFSKMSCKPFDPSLTLIAGVPSEVGLGHEPGGGIISLSMNQSPLHELGQWTFQESHVVVEFYQDGRIYPSFGWPGGSKTMGGRFSRNCSVSADIFFPFWNTMSSLGHTGPTMIFLNQCFPQVKWR